MAENIQDTLNERGARYGDFSDHALIVQNIMQVMTTAKSTTDRQATADTRQTTGTSFAWRKLDAVKRQSLTVIADKIARILNGDPNYDDNWRDIIGYAQLAFDRLPKDGNTVEQQAMVDKAQAMSKAQDAVFADAITYGTGCMKFTAEGATHVPYEDMHASDCATHNEPAMPVGECDCEDAGLAYRKQRMIDFVTQVVTQEIAIAALNGDDLTGLLSFLVEVDTGHATAERTGRKKYEDMMDRALRAESELVAAKIEIDKAWTSNMNWETTAAELSKELADCKSEKEGMVRYIDLLKFKHGNALTEIDHLKKQYAELAEGYNRAVNFVPEVNKAPTAIDLLQEQIASYAKKTASMQAVKVDVEDEKRKLEWQGQRDAARELPRALFDFWQNQRVYDKGYDSVVVHHD